MGYFKYWCLEYGRFSLLESGRWNSLGTTVVEGIVTGIERDWPIANFALGCILFHHSNITIVYHSKNLPKAIKIHLEVLWFCTECLGLQGILGGSNSLKLVCKIMVKGDGGNLRGLVFMTPSVSLCSFNYRCGLAGYPIPRTISFWCHITFSIGKNPLFISTTKKYEKNISSHISDSFCILAA